MRSWVRFLCPCGVWFLCGAIALAAADVTGVVTNRQQAPVPGASLYLESPNAGDAPLFAALSDEKGHFILPSTPPGLYQLRATAPGFRSESFMVEVGVIPVRPLVIVLDIATPSDTVTVTATRSEQTVFNIPATITVLNEQDISRSAGQTVDDVLRQMPGFSLFRRTGSLASHPTAQGVSLRGIGPSGVSRTLVLLDGVPLNDPFGGWVYWSRVPAFNLDKVEIVEGGHSSLYGNYALGGVINMTTRRPERRAATVRGQIGNQRTAQAEFFAGDKWGRTGVALQGHLFTTEGYRTIAPREQGPIDTHNRTGFGGLNLKIDYDLTPGAVLFIDGSFFDERRNNGTRGQHNGTVGKYLAGGARIHAPDGSFWQTTIFGHFQAFNSTFTSIAPDRRTERLTLTQNIPSNGGGASLQWSKKLSAVHEIVAGSDFLWTIGESREQLYNATGTRINLNRIAGGQQRSIGLFVQDLFTPTDRWRFGLSVRFDRWRNFSASQTDTATGGAVNRVDFSDKSTNLLNAKVSALYHVSQGIAVWSTFYKAFRAPTLNELYRQFRVGNVQTLANSQLGPERITEGAEVGLKYDITRRLFWSATGFLNRVKDPVTNVTLSVTPELITRQRQNLGRTRIRGLETQLEYQPAAGWLLSGRYLFDQAQVAEFAANQALEGFFIPQVPRHQFTVQARYLHPSRWQVATLGRFVGRQFDDDLNRFSLDRFFLMDLTASRPVNKSWEAFIALENLFNKTYMVGRTPFTTIGSPRRVHGGLRFNIGT